MIDCEDCGASLPLQVCKSQAGYYIGRMCPNCGPYERCSGYMESEVAAKLQLLFYQQQRGEI